MIGKSESDWVRTMAFAGLSEAAGTGLQALPILSLDKGMVLFRPGDQAQGFVLVLSGRIEVLLTGVSGREILLYAVEPGQSCVQTTLGLMAEESYTGEAVAAEETRVVLIPRGQFLRLIDEEPGFRRFVLTALGRRMQDVTRLLERVAFASIESRLAAELLAMAEGGVIAATQGEIAVRIGSAREVVTRRLDAFQKAGWVTRERGAVRILDQAALELAADVT